LALSLQLNFASVPIIIATEASPRRVRRPDQLGWRVRLLRWRFKKKIRAPLIFSYSDQKPEWGCGKPRWRTPPHATPVHALDSAYHRQQLQLHDQHSGRMYTAPASFNCRSSLFGHLLKTFKLRTIREEAEAI
jgi:hypothetical protein